ncbi:unnamed protein product [Symbiodinium pilosum]|uniref:EF-hand domain-containing protein n=1 Tax=Symbiodinium pilosum TaxID=2952 RepID=A0A812VM92_SYMPI|nr:unnamed protein product [Symbiodinium pilosum]
MEQEVVFCRGLTDSLKRSMPKHRWTSDDISHDSHGYDIDRLARELFLLHDLDGDGLLGEDELVQINLTIAVLHHGDNADLVHVEDSYRAMFREQFSPEGHDAIRFGCFRGYLLDLLRNIDPDVKAQKMILEQFITEAAVAREVRFQELQASREAGVTFLC